MRIIQCTQGNGVQVSVQCCVCLQMVPLQDALADLDGPAFQAYYHANCLAPLQTVEKTPTNERKG